MSGSIPGDLSQHKNPDNGQLDTVDERMEKVGGEPRPGGFFIIDSRLWRIVPDWGINPAAAYLALASGTGHSNKTTSWSTQSVMSYAGMGWERANQAIEQLITRSEEHT